MKPGAIGAVGVSSAGGATQTPSQVFPKAPSQGTAQPFPQKPPQTSPMMPPVRPMPSTQPLGRPSVQPSTRQGQLTQQLSQRPLQQFSPSVQQLPAEQPSTLLPKQASVPPTPVTSTPPIRPIEQAHTPAPMRPSTPQQQQQPQQQSSLPRPPVGTVSSMPNQGSQTAQQPPVIKPVSPVTPTPMRVTPASSGGSIFPGVSAPMKSSAQVTPQPVKPTQSAQQPQPSKQSISPKEQPGFKPAAPSDVKQSPFRFLPLVVGVLLLVGGLWFVITRFFGGVSAPKTAQNATQNAPVPVKQTTLTYWGLWESSPVFDQVIKDFQSQNAGVIINYIQQSPQDYRERLQDALQKGQGPDVFRYHATWVPMLKNQLSFLPSTIMSSTEFNQTFYPVAVKQLTTPNGIVGIPLMYDGLGLYYNKQMLQTVNLLPPTQWSDLETTARALTIRAKDKKISRAGVALGLTANVDNFSDILGLLILQNGGDPSRPSSKLVVDTVKYYTNFNKVLGVWDETLPNSTYAFATEKVAMMIAPSWRAFEVKAINPNLQFAIAPVPQLQGTSVTWGSYWVEGVSKTSKQQELSWKFLKYLSSKEVLLKLYSDAASKTPRLFGEIYPRVDMANTLASDPYVGAFVSDAPKASSWWMSSRTFDNGINDKIIKYYQDAINTVNSGQGLPADVLKNTEIGVQQVLQQNP